jgi:hypothetical protein
LVVLSTLLILAGLLLLVPSVPLWSLLATGSTSPASTSAFRITSAASSTDSTTTAEALVGFGMVGVGLILEVFSLFTDVGVSAQGAVQQAEKAGERA